MCYNHRCLHTMSSSRAQHRLYIALAVAILLFALLLRLRGLDTTGLWGDQAFTLNKANKRIAVASQP